MLYFSLVSASGDEDFKRRQPWGRDFSSDDLMTYVVETSISPSFLFDVLVVVHLLCITINNYFDTEYLFDILKKLGVSFTLLRYIHSSNK